MNAPAGDSPDGGSTTRSQRREAARARRRAKEAEVARAAVRRRRIWQLAGVGAAAVLAVVLVAVLTGGGASPSHESDTAMSEASRTVGSLLTGIPQHENVLGDPDAPVTLQYFGDLECSYCREFTLYALPEIISHDVRRGKVKIEYLSHETATPLQTVFQEQQVAAYAAGRQNLAWYFIELFYHEQGEEETNYVTERYLQGLARQVPGLNLSRWQADRSENALVAEVQSDEHRVIEDRIEGTPSFMIGRSGGPLRLFSPPSLRESRPFEAEIEELE